MTAQQQNAPSETQALRELVAEVRELRLTVERANSVSLRLQITLQRIQLDQNQVNRVSGQLESLRREIMPLEAAQNQISASLADIDTRIEQEQNPDTKKMIQAEQKDMKAQFEQRSRLIQDQRTREGELASSLQTEQEKLNDLQDRVDSLANEIKPQRPQ